MTVSEARFEAAKHHLSASSTDETELSETFRELFDLDGAAVSTLGTLLGSETHSATDALAARIDELQFDLGEGPCWDAMATARPVLEPVIAERKEHWPAFVHAVESDGVTSIFAFPLRFGPLQIGAIDMFSMNGATLDSTAERRATALAQIVGRRLLVRALADSSHEDSERPTPFSRRIVHQATGMVMSQVEISAEDAELLIQGHAYARGVSVMEIAREVVENRVMFTIGGDGIERIS